MCGLAVAQLSYDALHETEQRLFARLPVELLDDAVSGIIPPACRIGRL